MTGASGLGSWPGTDVREALRVVRGELTGALPEGVSGLPYLPELPGRGPGADTVGRSTHLLVDMPVDLQPQGWRLVDRPGRDHERTGSWWRQDLDELAEAFDGYHGPLKVQVAGPWTLAASVWLPLGDRVLSDPGATGDLAESLAEGVAGHVAEVRRLVPGAEVVLQVDEPMISTVVLGRVRSDSGYRVLAAPDAGRVVAALRRVLAGSGADRTVVHTCAAEPPVALLAQTGPSAVSVDVSLLRASHWDDVGQMRDAGVQLWAGVLPTDGDPSAYAQNLQPLLRRWHELGLPRRDLAEVVVTPACGLAGLSPQDARATTTATVQAASQLAEVAAE